MGEFSLPQGPYDLVRYLQTLDPEPRDGLVCVRLCEGGVKPPHSKAGCARKCPNSSVPQSGRRVRGCQAIFEITRPK
jgi:hypothetical protein